MLVVLNDQIHYAREVEKRNTTALNTFQSPNRGPAGHVAGQNVRFYAARDRAWRKERLPDRSGRRAAEGRDRLRPCQHGPGIHRSSSQGRRKGIVVAGVGDGNMTSAATEGLADAARAGVAVVRSSRTGSGAVDRNVEVDDDKLNFIASGELNPQKARVLLMLGLLKSNNVGTCKGISTLLTTSASVLAIPTEKPRNTALRPRSTPQNIAWGRVSAKERADRTLSHSCTRAVAGNQGALLPSVKFKIAHLQALTVLSHSDDASPAMPTDCPRGVGRKTGAIP